MRRYVAKRLLLAVPTVIGVFLAVFLVIRAIPGDPAVAMLGVKATDAQIAQFRETYGLDKPVAAQAAIALGKFLTGDLGRSIKYQQSVTSLLGERFPRTFELAMFGVVIGSTLGIALGVVSSLFRGRWPDRALTAVSTVVMAIPGFYMALLVLIVLALGLKAIPVIGTPRAGVSHFQTLVGPLITMAAGSLVVTLRTTRSGMLEVVGEDFIRTARAKGLAERAVMLGHALRNALLPIITMIGFELGGNFTGAIMVESVFTRPGVGLLLIEGINTRDYAVVQGVATFLAILLILVNLLTDVVYGLADPRVRLDAAKGGA
jgi:ABC-type dipeptide/oligopeptide/nickel transport system permease component